MSWLVCRSMVEKLKKRISQPAHINILDTMSLRQSQKSGKHRLNGWSFMFFLCTQDFVIYLLAGPNIIFGQQSDHEDGSKPDIFLFAADILPKHCYFRRNSVGSPTTLCPCQDAVVTRNGEVLRKEVQLNPGDVIGLGQRYLFLFKDPLALSHKVSVRYRRDRKVRAHMQSMRFFYLVRFSLKSFSENI